MALSVDVTIGGVSFDAYLIRSRRKTQLCDPSETEVELEFNALTPAISPWDALTITESGVLVLTGFVERIFKERPNSVVRVTAKDTYKRCTDWFIHESLEENNESVLYWVDYLCSLCGIEYAVSGNNGDRLVGRGIPIGLRSVADALNSIIAYAGWIMRVKPDGLLEFIDSEKKNLADYTVTNILEIDYDVNDSTTRNVAKVWGYDPDLGEELILVKSRPVSEIGQERIMVFANPNIQTREQASGIADAALSQFGQLERGVIARIVGNANLVVGDVARISSGGIDRTDLITDIESVVSESGYEQTVRIARRCFRLQDFPVNQSNQDCDPGTELFSVDVANARDCSSIVATQDGVYVVGISKNISDPAYFSKLDPEDGSQLFQQGFATDPLGDLSHLPEIASDGFAAYICYIGDSPVNESQWVIEKRLCQNGLLVWSVESHPSSPSMPEGRDIPLAIAIDDLYVYVGGMADYDEDRVGVWRLEKRVKTNGALVWDYDFPGPPYQQQSDKMGRLQGIVSDGDSVYSCGWRINSLGTTIHWRIAKNDTNGQLVWATEFEHVNTVPNEDEKSGARVIAEFGEFVYAFGYSWETTQYRVVKLNKSDGSVVWSVDVGASGSDIQRSLGIACNEFGVYVGKPGLFPDFEQILKLSHSDGSVIWQVDPNDSLDPTGISLSGGAVYVSGGTSLLSSGTGEVAKLCDDVDTCSEGTNKLIETYPDMTLLNSVSVATDGAYIAGNEPSATFLRVKKVDPDDGSLIWEQDISGVVPGGFSGNTNIIQSDTFLFVSAASGSPDYAWVIKKLRYDTGSEIWSVSSSFGAFQGWPYGISQYSASIYVCGYRESDPDFWEQWRVEKRSKGTGSLTWSYQITPDGDMHRTNPLDIHTDGRGVYVCGWDRPQSSSNRIWRVEKLIASTGALSWSVTFSGMGTTPQCEGVFVYGDHVYIVGIDKSVSPERVVAKKLNTSDGSLVWSVNISNAGFTPSQPDIFVGYKGVYVLSRLFTGTTNRLRLDCLSRDDGSTVWTYFPTATSAPVRLDGRLGDIFVASQSPATEGELQRICG